MTTLALTDDQAEYLAAWRAKALELMPYWSPMLFAFRPVNVPGLGTFACDDQMRLYIDFDAVIPKGMDWCFHSLIHECGHPFNNHADRSKAHDVKEAQLKDWNVAGDFEINDDLVQSGATTLSDMLPGLIGMEEGKLAETYFDAIAAKRAAKGNKPQPGQPQPGTGQNGQSEGSQGGQSQPGDGQGQGQPQSGGGQPSADADAGESEVGVGGGPDQSGWTNPFEDKKPFEGCGSGAGSAPAPCELGDSDMDGQAPGVDAAEGERIRMATALTILEFAKSRGTVPAGLLAKATQMLAPPKVNWKAKFTPLLRRATKTGKGAEMRSYKLVNRRKRNITVLTASGARRKVIFPGVYTPKIECVIVRDTSGSVSNGELNEITNEIVGIAKAMRITGDDLLIMDVDAAVHQIKGFKSAAALAEVQGRGGTDMVVGILAANELDPTVIVVATDGETKWPTTRLKTPVIALLVGPTAPNMALRVPKWITTIVVEKA